MAQVKKAVLAEIGRVKLSEKAIEREENKRAGLSTIDKADKSEPKHNTQAEISESAVKLWMIDNQSGRRNLTDGWRFELAQVKKAVLAEIGRAKISAAVSIANSIAPKKSDSTLSTIDKVEKEPKHDTRAEIAKAFVNY